MGARLDAGAYDARSQSIFRAPSMRVATALTAPCGIAVIAEAVHDRHRFACVAAESNTALDEHPFPHAGLPEKDRQIALKTNSGSAPAHTPASSLLHQRAVGGLTDHAKWLMHIHHAQMLSTPPP